MKEKKTSKIKVRKTVRQDLPFSFSFLNKIKNKILGKKYELSVVFIGSTMSERLNKETRGKDGPANVLALPLDDDFGEIFIDFNKSKKEAEKFDLPFKDFLIFLFIHGSLHLKGLRHGSKMNKEEEKLLKEFTS